MTMPYKHSPGPWTFNDFGNQVLDARNGSSQGLVAVVQVNTYRDEGRYNAALIATAPELLACAQRSAAALRSAGVEPNAHSDNPLEWLLHETEAAISKALSHDG